MAGPVTCSFHQFGHCRFGDHCRKSHTKETCTNLPCTTIVSCTKRHPRLCKYFALSGQCKFNQECSFLHMASPKEVEQKRELKKLSDEVESLRKQVVALKSVVESFTSHDPNPAPVPFQSQASATALPISVSRSIIVTTVESTLDSSIENSLPQIDGAMNSPTNSFPVNSAPLPQCDTCHAIFESVEDFKEHDTAQFCCDDCGICYRTQEAADLHTLELHPDTHYARTYIPLSTKVLFANSQTRKP